MWVFLNNRFVAEEDATVSVFDHGFLYGDGVYETLRAYDRKIFLLRQHLARLSRSADLIGLPLPFSEKDWPPLLQEALERNRLTDAYLRITVSRGPGKIGLDPGLCPTPTVVIFATPLPPYAEEWYETGVRLTVAGIRRNHPSALSPHIKSLNFLNNILAKQEALQRGAFDAVMLNTDGYVAECTTSNIFFVTRGSLRTPSIACGLLDGITRSVVLALARESAVEVQEDAYLPAALFQADECFLTNTTMEVMPVSQIDGTPIGTASCGPVTRRLRTLFRARLPMLLE